ncbi:MAG: dTDP-4-dehydrorhamnose reductase [Candidatus Gastranaerophilales bacterium]|nr:dTDP-4-dehydrorhamnose reductase [Candidatus Gastranaerophilales bacterium]
MKVLVTGVGGQLGYDVVRELGGRGIETVGTSSRDMDITDARQVEKVIKEAACDAVIHCAAYTAVDAAQDDEENCRKVNVDGPQNIANVCKSLDIKMLYVSTDYVFGGQGETPWEPEDPKEPQSVYGRTKYEGELAVQNTLEKYFIVRVAWTYGINGKNFVKTMLKLAENHKRITVVNDQFGSPTYTRDLAILLADMIQTEKYGVYHASNEGFCSWYEFACAIFEKAGIEMEVAPVTTAEYGAKAPRPQNSRLSKRRLTENGFDRLPPWEDALDRYLEELL